MFDLLSGNLLRPFWKEVFLDQIRSQKQTVFDEKKEKQHRKRLKACRNNQFQEVQTKFAVFLKSLKKQSTCLFNSNSNKNLWSKAFISKVVWWTCLFVCRRNENIKIELIQTSINLHVIDLFFFYWVSIGREYHAWRTSWMKISTAIVWAIIYEPWNWLQIANDRVKCKMTSLLAIACCSVRRYTKLNAFVLLMGLSWEKKKQEKWRPDCKIWGHNRGRLCSGKSCFLSYSLVHQILRFFLWTISVSLQTVLTLLVTKLSFKFVKWKKSFDT